MAIPSGYSLLGRIGYNDRGVYTKNSDYVRGDVVYHEGSSYVALTTVTGVTPADDNTNWKYLARGFGATELSEIDATDTSGFAGDAGKKVKGQTLIDKIAEYVMSKVVATDAFQTYLQKFLVDNCVTERSDLSLSAAQGKVLMDYYTKLYSDYIIKEFTLPNTNEGKIGQDISLLHYVPIGNSVITKYNQWRTNLFTVAFSDDGNIYATNVENNLYGQKCYILFCKI
nr:MAG TPA: hypothetical protein [Caudoviricetes sp.]